MAIEQVTILVTDILTPTKAAEYLGVSRMTLWRWTKGGKITPIMLDHTYFHIRELERLQEEAHRHKGHQRCKEKKREKSSRRITSTQLPIPTTISYPNHFS